MSLRRCASNVSGRWGLAATVVCGAVLAVAAPTRAQPANGRLIIVGDRTLTYASYVFLLPPSWVPGFEQMDLTHERGIWRGRHATQPVWIQVVPTRKEAGETLADFVVDAKEQPKTQAGCSPDAFAKSTSFRPMLSYPYEVHTLTNCPQGTSGLLVFAELPEHVVTFNLYGRASGEADLQPYVADFGGVLRTFRWTLGLSDQAVGEMVTELQGGT